MANVQRGHLLLGQIKEVEVPEEEVSRYLLTNGDLLITEGGDWDKVGRTAIWRDELPECLHQNHVFRARPVSLELSSRWVEMYLNSPLARRYFAGSAKQTTNLASINMTQLKACSFPVPPPAEQHRIVAKADELMALCDRLEADQVDADAAHAELVQALLDSLTQATDAADFRASWQRLSEHFHTLFSTEASIDALKQAVLQLAVMGKLVPQTDDDEPASILMQRAEIEKKRMVADGRLRRERNTSASASRVLPFNVPSGWAWATMADVLHFLNGYAFKSEWFRPIGVRLLRNINVGHGSIDWHDQVCLPDELAEDFAAFSLTAGDLVLTLDRPIISTGLKIAVLRDEDLPCLLLQRVAKLSSFAGVVSTRYLSIWLNSTFFTDEIDPGRSNGVPHISTTQVGAMSIALPPLAEQHRIVAKVDELMALCDQLKAQLAKARDQHVQLATALVEQAVA